MDDFLPVTLKKVSGDCSCMKARIISGFRSGSDASTAYDDMLQDSVNPKIWKMLVEINTKLNLILDQFCLEREGLNKVERQVVSLSASGLRTKASERFEIGDFVEIGIYLPTNVPLWIAVYGKVMRNKEISPNEYEVAVRFCEMDEEIRDKIFQYTLKRQREIIRTRDLECM